MENDGQVNNILPKAVLFEDWFVRAKKLRFGPVHKKEEAHFDIRINERIFDKPHIKTVVWGNV